MTIPPTPGADTPMTLLMGNNICQSSAEGMSTEAITCLLIPQDIAELTIMSTSMIL
jgi:hypothetical protein